MKNKNGRKIPIFSTLAILLAIIASIAFSAGFAYYPINITLSPVSPPIVFDNGKNAGQPDLGGGNTNTISVSLGTNKTSVSITLHPTWQTTYYKNVTIIKNTDSKAYNIYLKVTQALSLPSGSSAYIYIYSKGAARSLSGFPSPTPASGTYISSISLTQTGTTYTSIGSLSGSGVWELDIYVYIPEGSYIPSGSSYTANILLAYTPSSGEAPP